MGEPASAVRSLSRRAKPSGIRGEAGKRSPSSDIPQMVGDRMTGRPSAGIREIGWEITEFMPLGGRRAAPDEVRASVVATKRVTTVERRERRKMEGSWTERQTLHRCECPRGLSRRGDRTSPEGWDDTVERKATLETMRRACSLSPRPHQPESRMREIRPSGLEGGVALRRYPYPYPHFFRFCVPMRRMDALTRDGRDLVLSI